MLGESNQKPYNIMLKNVVQTMIKIVIKITNDLEWLSFLESAVTYARLHQTHVLNA